MKREESSVTSSLQQLMHDEERRRAEQVKLAHRRKIQQDEELLREHSMRAEQAKRDAERAAEEKRAEHERLQLERQLELERTRAELELRNRARLMEQEQQQAIERLSIERDAKLRRLEGQRLTLLALLVTLLVGTTALWGLLLQPEQRRNRELVKQLNLSYSAVRLESQRERASLMTQISDLESVVRELRFKLSAQSDKVPGVNPGDAKPNAQRPIRVRTATEPGKRNCDAHDPLCGDLG